MVTRSVPPARAADPLTWTPWRVNWSAIWVGALAALAAAIVLGLLGTAIGASAARSLSWSAVTKLDVAVAVLGAFFAFVVGGWTTVKVAGIPYAEPAILHATIAWLVALPVMLVLLALGAGSAFGGWYGGIAGPPSVAAGAVVVEVSVRATALASLTTILVGLIGSVIGGWIASGEPMTFTHYRSLTTVWVEPERRMVP
jgi:hypothetical protein